MQVLGRVAKPCPLPHNPLKYVTYSTLSDVKLKRAFAPMMYFASFSNGNKHIKILKKSTKVNYKHLKHFLSWYFLLRTVHFC